MDFLSALNELCFEARGVRRSSKLSFEDPAEIY